MCPAESCTERAQRYSRRTMLNHTAKRKERWGEFHRSWQHLPLSSLPTRRAFH